MASGKWRDGRLLLYFQSKAKDHRRIFFFFFFTFVLLWEQRKENVSAWINKNKFVSLPKLCFTQTWARRGAKFCRFQKRRRWAENPSAVNQSFSLFLVFVTVINDKNNKEYRVNVVKSCEICAARLILPCAALLRKVCGWSAGWSKRRKGFSFLSHTYGAARPFCFDFRGFRL